MRSLGGGVLVLGLAAMAGGLIVAATTPGQQRLAASVERIEMLRVQAEELGDRIVALEQASSSDAPGPTVARTAPTASEAALDLQQSVVDLARQNGLEPSTFGSQPAPDGLTLPAVGVVLEGEGELSDLARFLGALEAARPPIAVSQLTLRDESRLRAEGALAPVAFRIAAWSFWTEGEG